MVRPAHACRSIVPSTEPERAGVVGGYIRLTSPKESSCLVRLFRVDNWLHTPADRDVISHWTVGDGAKETNPDALAGRHTLVLPEPPDANNWEFLALGDTGDAAAAGPGVSPQDAVATEMARDADLGTNGAGRGRMVVHTGDVVYMTGEHRLYDRNFRRPYAPFLTPGSTVDDLVFRLPFLPVPGNHDYYDLGGWARWVARVPLLAPGLRALAHQLFSFSVPEGGSNMGRSYMDAFVDRERLASASKAGADALAATPLPYQPGTQTRLPNRYYRFSTGGVDFFALDSNTLDAPPPGTSVGQVRQAAAERVKILEAKSDELDRALAREQRARQQQRHEQREETARDPARRALLAERVAGVSQVLARLRATLATAAETAGPAGAQALGAATLAERRWTEGAEDFTAPDATTTEVIHALDVLDEASDQGCNALVAIESALATLPESPLRAQIIGARDETERAQSAWAEIVSPPPDGANDRLRKLSEDLLDVQRELTLERRRLRYRPDDHDAVQLRWLDAALLEARQNRPGNWRIVFLHHPLYTTIANHCERPDVTDLRDNVLAVLQRHDIHLVLSGHSHAFEWFRSNALPNTGIVVSGGGGQIVLRPSLLSPRLLARRRPQYDALRAAGVRELAMAGAGPAASDGENGPVYHYLRLHVTPDTLTVRPVGVRRLEGGAFRREEPMPVFHAERLPEDRPPWRAQRLESLVVRRGAPPRANWV